MNSKLLTKREEEIFKMLLNLKDDAEIVIVISADAIAKNKRRGNDLFDVHNVTHLCIYVPLEIIT